MAHHACGVPGEVAVTAALDELAQAVINGGRVGAAHDVFGKHAGGVGQGGPGARLQRFDSLAGIKVVQLRAGQLLAIQSVHERGAGSCGRLVYLRSWIGTNVRSSGPV
ncbi:hypothetical protein D3C71_1762390 [compost metagenome]